MAPLLDRRTYTGWVFALLGAMCWLPAGVIALLAVLPNWPRRAEPAIFLVVLVAGVAAKGLFAQTRQGWVWLANQMLGTAIPEAGTRPLWSARLRTAVWLVVLAVSGGALMLVTGMLALTTVLLPLLWLNGGDTVTYLFADISIAAGTAGLWTIAVALAQLPVAAYLTAATAAWLRWLAPRLLGPYAAEKLVAVEERADDLARRNRLAQELHDSIGHTLTTSTIQAAVANQLMESDPASARQAMTTIEESSRQALDDLDHVLGVLRQEAATREPKYTLADVGPLLDRVAATGTTVQRHLGHGLTSIPATVSREAYRVVQEAVTNALRHAPGEPVEVTVEVSARSLGVRVVNPLPKARPNRPGRGLAGTAERVRLLHGEVTAGADEDGTHWVLSARLPLPQ